MPQYRIVFARFPGRGLECFQSSNWVMQHVIKALEDPRLGKGRVHCWEKADTPITMVRNEAVLVARAKEADYLVMIDSDMEPDYYVGREPHAKPFWESSWEFLMAHRDEPCCIGAPYSGPGTEEVPFGFKWTNRRTGETGQNPDFKLSLLSRDEAALRGGIMEAPALPTGLIIYDMRVFHEDLVPWFDYEHDRYKSRKESTEDVYQTRNQSLAWHMSGGRKGGKVYCNWDAWARHLKTTAIEKPQNLTIETVSEQLRKAARSDVEIADRLTEVDFLRNGEAIQVPWTVEEAHA